MTLAIKAMLCLLSALILAVASMRLVLRRRRGDIRNGAWETDREHGSARAGLYQRAQTALYRLWGLNSTEAIYFLARTDSEGKTLSHEAVYRICGADLDARWWSITAYKNSHLIPNIRHRYSFSKSTLQQEQDGRWTLFLASAERGPNWLPSGRQKGDLVLNLRVFNPGPTLMRNLASTQLPTIQREPGR